jgi:hypothetical protein
MFLQPPGRIHAGRLHVVEAGKGLQDQKARLLLWHPDSGPEIIGTLPYPIRSIRPATTCQKLAVQLLDDLRGNG